MHLLQALANTPLCWSVAPVEVALPRGHSGTKMRMTVTLAPGETPQFLDFPIYGSHTPEGMMALVLKKVDPANPVLLQWLESKGNSPVALEPDILESVSEAMHTALRKLASSKSSAITWHSLHHMHQADSVALWNGVRQLLTEMFAPGTPVTRRALAKALRDKVLAITDECRFKLEVPDAEGDLVKRKKLEEYSLMMMHTGCGLTDLDEWMWSWLGYVVTDVAPALPATTTA
jgi:hypothetical protein